MLKTVESKSVNRDGGIDVSTTEHTNLSAICDVPFVAGMHSLYDNVKGTHGLVILVIEHWVLIYDGT